MKKNISPVSPANILSTISHMAKCQLGFGLVAKSTPRFAKAKTTASEYALQFGRDIADVIKVTCVTNARSYGYESACERGQVRSGATANFSADGLSGAEWVIYPLVKKTEKGLLVSISYKDSDNTRFESRYFHADGTACSEEEDSFIKEHLYHAPVSKKQLESGIDPAQVTKVCGYFFDRILAIGKNGEVTDFFNAL